jgi:hypothetical protein
MEAERPHANSHKLVRIAQKLKDKLYRDSFVAARARRFLAHQMRAIRGAMSQAEFGKLIDKPQSVVSRFEDPSYGKMTINSLLDIASKVDRALVVQFVDWTQFLKMTEDDSESASSPAPYDAADIDDFATREEQSQNWQQLFGNITPVMTGVYLENLQAYPLNVNFWPRYNTAGWPIIAHGYEARIAELENELVRVRNENARLSGEVKKLRMHILLDQGSFASLSVRSVPELPNNQALRYWWRHEASIVS